jgi:acetylornithine aminotransferase
VQCAAALAVIDVIDRENLCDRAAALGAELETCLDRLIDAHPVAVGHRGRGLLQALVLAEPVADRVVAAALDAGLVVNDVAPDAVRLAPPLVIDDAALRQMTERLDTALSAVS